MTQETKYPEAARELQEAIFDGLPEAERANWHVAFAEKAATVTDWQMVIDKTVLASLRIAEPHDTSESKVVAAVIDLYERRLSGDNPSESEWTAALCAARPAAWDARDAALALRRRGRRRARRVRGRRRAAPAGARHGWAWRPRSGRAVRRLRSSAGF